MNYFWIFRIDIMLVMQEAAQLYTFVPRDLSSWSMPVTWQMQQKGNDFEKLIMKVLWRWLTYIVMNWCSFPVWCIIIHQRLAACYLSTSFSCQQFLLQGYCSLSMSNIEKRVAVSRCSSSLSKFRSWSQRYIQKSLWNWTSSL